MRRSLLIALLLPCFFVGRLGNALVAPSSTKHHRSNKSKFKKNPSSAAPPENDASLSIRKKQKEHETTFTDDNGDEGSSRRAFLGVMVVSTGLILTTTDPSEAAEEEAKSDNEVFSSSSASSPTTHLSDAAATAIDWKPIFQKASKKALGGGRAGASAAVVQVCALMWLRTSMNYQYRYGGNLQSSLSQLWKDGGLPRLYQGLPFALVQGPMTRFGDTAANVGILALLETLPATQEWPLPLKTACGSAAAGLWRIVLMPIDASKTVMQVEGQDGLQKLWTSASPTEKGPGVLYRGALAQAAATAVGHFPWFLTYNFLDSQLPLVSSTDDMLLSLARSAVLGFSSSCVSDCCSNSLRVIKTTKQTAQLGGSDASGVAVSDPSYTEIIKLIIEQDGIAGLFGRGLQTRLLTNAIQGAVFSILWKYFQQGNGV